MQACKNIGYKSSVIDPKERILKYDIIIIPGVGSFKFAMKYLKLKNLENKIKNFVTKKDKLLFGICLGMQLLFDESEEFGKTKGLGLLKGKVKRINYKNLKVPHIGWNYLIKKKNLFLPKDIFNKQFYFTHSFYCDPVVSSEINTLTKYGQFNFCSSIKKKNIIGTQFHPEKSGKTGLKILKKISDLI